MTAYVSGRQEKRIEEREGETLCHDDERRSVVESALAGVQQGTRMCSPAEDGVHAKSLFACRYFSMQSVTLEQ